ncbi:glutamyl endopeptidase [Actinoalloteichus hoggarensis]|uniref:Serine protease n=2 Tax=Actinoalloteichus hoggarensis TaxID=1470176 RepID=A0A221VXB4_9PSEU|nr:serine protease [Actinoalloteichus hoggarensis]ASO17891.1 Glutamyl endopeptidase precursor [Actinoalloteichus hoggarensis]MBB5924303.1 glutamyl endopeptidase [Actinoalloteichus hoggarensis]
MQTLPRAASMFLCAALTITLTSGTSTAFASSRSDFHEPTFETARPVGQDFDGRILSPFDVPTRPAPDGVNRSFFAGTGGPGDVGSSVVDDVAPPETTFGDGEPLSIFEPDQRSRAGVTTTFPSRAVVHTTATGRGGCSGFLVSADTVLTAGHCLHPGGTGSAADFYTNVRVAPGRNGSTLPYGSCGRTTMWTDQTWIDSSNTNQDWGVIKLDCAVGNTTGWFGFRWQSASYDGTHITIRGYPGDKQAGTMWFHGGPIRQSLGNKLHYTVDTVGGQSGSPVYNDDLSAIAIHSNGRTPQVDYNKGTRITQSLFEFIDGVR